MSFWKRCLLRMKPLKPMPALKFQSKYKFFAAVPLVSIPTYLCVYAEERQDKNTILETKTGLYFNKSILLPANKDAGETVDIRLEMVAVGARCVTFLQFSVYGVALYMTPESLSQVRNFLALEKIKAENEGRFENWLDENVLETILKLPIDVSLLIVPSRNTAGSHIRAGFSRFLTSRLVEQSPSLLDEDKKKMQDAISELEKCIPRQTISTGANLLLRKSTSGDTLLAYMDNAPIGMVHNTWLARNFFEGYLCERTNPPSPTLKKNVISAFESLIVE